MQQPPLHRLPAQHGAVVEVDVLGVPQTTQMEDVLQIVLAAVHALFAQQGCPAAPHATHVLFEQVVPASWQDPPGDELEQQGCPLPPQTLQL